MRASAATWVRVPPGSPDRGPVTPSGRRHPTLNREARAHPRFESWQVHQATLRTSGGEQAVVCISDLGSNTGYSAGGEYRALGTRGRCSNPATQTNQERNGMKELWRRGPKWRGTGKM